jgi:hypothetical protein
MAGLDNGATHKTLGVVSRNLRPQDHAFLGDNGTRPRLFHVNCHPIHERIPMVRVMMKHHKLFHIRSVSQLNAFFLG